VLRPLRPVPSASSGALALMVRAVAPWAPTAVSTILRPAIYARVWRPSWAFLGLGNGPVPWVLWVGPHPGLPCRAGGAGAIDRAAESFGPAARPKQA
jgi:hypothetical protein